MLSNYFKDKFFSSSLKNKLDQTCYGVMAAILLSIFIFAYIGSHRSITAAQYQTIQAFSQQASYPKTQHLARKILLNTPIYRKDYLKLLRAHRYESKRIRQYPAMAQDDE